MSAAAAAEPRSRRAARPVVLLAGNPNCGKTTVFNALTGARAKVGNYPGITVDRRSASLRLPGNSEVELCDLPGTYSLSAHSAEEQVAVDAVLGRGVAHPSAVVVILDATALARGLYLALQIVEAGVPAVIALNMMDDAGRAGLRIDLERLGERLGAEVVPLVASKGEGKAELLAAIDRCLRGERPEPPPLWPLGEALAGDVDDIGAALPADEAPDHARRAHALWALLSVGDDELAGVPPALRSAVARARDRAEAAGRDLDREIIEGRYRVIDELVAEVVRQEGAPARRLTDRIDAVLVHPVWGFCVFLVVMAVLFESLFSWTEPVIAAIELGIAALQRGAAGVMPEGPLRELVVSGVIAGVGNVVVFVPQIALLFLFITVLEDSGYLARVAFAIDRLMGGVGLNGKAFVPMLSGFACAVPAVMATRTIESRRDRLLTMLVVPLSSCSARLPVYVLVTAAVFHPDTRVFGVVSLGAVVLFSMYLLSIAAALGAAAVLRRTVLKGPRPPLLLELPPYRAPQARNALLAAWQRVKSFLVDAGTLILAMTIVLWALLSYPKSPEAEARAAREREAAAAIVEAPEREARLAEIDSELASEQLRRSAAGRLGHVIEPAIAPLGFDWRIGVGILGAFSAREVFVSTLGVVFGIGEADEGSEPLRDRLRDARRADGSTLFTPLTGVSLMVFFVLACQCMSTLAVVRRESGSWRWPAFLFVYMSALAYLASLAVYQIGRALGWGLGA